MDLPIPFVRGNSYKTIRVRCTWQVVVSSDSARWGQAAAQELQEEGSEGLVRLYKLGMWPRFAKPDVWGQLGSLFRQSETSVKWYLRESLTCRWQMNLCLQMRSPATGWQVFIFNAVLLLSWLRSMRNLSTLQQYVEVSRSTFEKPFARQDCSLLLLMKLLWTAGSNGCEKVAPCSSLKSNIFISLVTEDGNCDNGYFWGYKDILYFPKMHWEHC